MLRITDTLALEDWEITESFSRSQGPGGQNVNKVASKAVLRWHLEASPSLSDEVKIRLRTLQRRRISGEGDLIVTAQNWRDQEKNREACLEKLRAMIVEALQVPKPRRPTRPTRGSRQRRLAAKKRRAETKADRRSPTDG